MIHFEFRKDQSKNKNDDDFCNLRRLSMEKGEDNPALSAFEESAKNKNSPKDKNNNEVEIDGIGHENFIIYEKKQKESNQAENDP
jgi:hypothetical protein